jgi:hypothetical protein
MVSMLKSFPASHATAAFKTPHCYSPYSPNVIFVDDVSLTLQVMVYSSTPKISKEFAWRGEN